MNPLEQAQKFAAEAARKAYWEDLSQWGYPLFMLVFALAALLLLVAVLLPRTKRSTLHITLGQCGAVVLFFMLTTSMQLSIDRKRGFIADQERRLEAQMARLTTKEERDQALQAQYLYMPQGDSLKYLSLGNTGLASDYVWLTGTQYVSNAFRRGKKFELLFRFYTTMMDLDPHWIESITNAGKVLSALEPDRFKVEKFYIQAASKNPGDWRVEYDAGRLFVVPPMNPADRPEYSKHAADWFDLALTHLRAKAEKNPTAEIKHNIKDVEGLRARMGLEAGYYEAAAELLFKHATDENNPLAFRQVSACDYLNAKSLVYATHLSALVNEYKKEIGSFPPSLDAVFQKWPEKRKECTLTQSGPVLDEFGYPMLYNPATGEVASRGVNVRRAIASAAVLDSLITQFTNSTGRKAKNLNEVRDFARQTYANPKTRSSALLDAFGLDLDLLRCPIGKWDYDPVKGEIKLPPDADVKLLYHNARKFAPAW